jgi:serine O-acetyltransferase
MSWIENIRKDQLRYAKPGIMGFFKAYKNPGFRFFVLFRVINRFAKYHPIGFLLRLFYRYSQVRYGFQIAHYTKIGGGIYIPHFGGIVISSHVILGENCNIAQGVTIGRINAGPRKGAPKIGNQVWIGPNAVLSGNIKIGDNVLIAPLAFVNMDVPSNSLVIGNPAKIVAGKTSHDYINFYS